MGHHLKKILILTHEAHPLDSQRYLVGLVAARWRECGIEVKEVRGLDRFEDADLAVQHVNLTVVPREYVQLLDRYPVVINRGAVDISKSRVSTNLVGPGDAYSGPVIVKTDRNFGGRPEEALRRQGHWGKQLGSRVLERLSRRFAPLTARTRTLKRYPVFPSLDAVPDAVFANPHLVVEKFLPEFHDGCYWLRTYVFLGDRHVGGLASARQTPVKAANTVSSETIPVPDELHAARARLGFDYGKFDYVVHDGRIVLLDANRTPTYATVPPSPRVLTLARTLADGVFSLAAPSTAHADRRRCA